SRRRPRTRNGRPRCHSSRTRRRHSARPPGRRRTTRTGRRWRVCARCFWGAIGSCTLTELGHRRSAGGGSLMLCSRRHFLTASGRGIGSLALAPLLRELGLLAAPSKPLLVEPTYDLLPKKPHFEPKAKAMISIFLIGGPSQIDLFDYKPALAKLDGKDFPDAGAIKYDNPAQASKRVLGPAWKFKKYGHCGMEMSELIPHIGSIADDITLIRSMHTGVNNHLPSMYALNTGRQVPGRAHLGSWLSYG